VTEKDQNKGILRTLSQILTVGNLIHAIPVGIKLCEFLYSEMKSIEGVENCRICLGSLKEPFGDHLSDECKKCTFFQKGRECELNKLRNTNLRSFPLFTSNGKYAFITLSLTDQFAEEIIPAIHNLANITAILIENDFQKNALQKSYAEVRDHRVQLQQKVLERTAELENANVQLLKAVTILNQAQSVAHVGHWELDLVKDILIWSDEVFNIFEVDPAEFNPNLEGFLELIHPEDREKTQVEFAKSIADRSPYNIEHRLLVKSGVIKYVQEIGRIEYDQEGNAISAVGMVLDITSRKNAELLLSESERKLQRQNEEYERLNKDLLVAIEKAEENDHLKTAFLHNISHEIRTPMNAIVGFSGILGTPGLAEEKREKYIDIIVKSSNQLLSIIDDIVKIATIEAGQARINSDTVKLDEMLRLLFNQYVDKALEKNIDLRFKKGSQNHLEIITDAVKLEEILINLIGNAIKFTDSGYVELGYSVNQRWLEFYVKDTGIGIPMELQKKVFERFRQAEVTTARLYGGSGLGLSISKSYVELLGGKIWLESQPDIGSTFYFNLPYSEAMAKENSIPAMNEKMRLEYPKKILVAEDEDFNYLFLEEILGLENLKLVRATNGLEATELCKTDRSIDLVLMDIKMPVLDGYSATTMIRKFRPELPVIAQTALSHDSDREKALNCGCNDYIRKPIVRNELFRLLRKYL
jgi:signal transduction histidine kinase/CheY-like chemotaxis protein